MNYLRIELNSIPEVVDYTIIHKLYEKVKEIPEPLEGEEDNVYLSGNLLTLYSYEGESGYLTTRCPDLYINITGGEFIIFEDPNITAYLKSKSIGVLGNVTKALAAAVNSIASSANNTIIKFNDLTYFTNITQSTGGFEGTGTGSCNFKSWTALEEIDISNFTSISHETATGDAFTGCTSLRKVTTSNKLTQLGWSAFLSCSKLEDIDVSNVTFFGNNCFAYCTALTHLDISNAVTIGDLSFYNCKNISEFVNLSLPNLSGTLGRLAFYSCSQIKNVVNLGNITEIGYKYNITNAYANDPFLSCVNIETVIVPETVTKISGFLNHTDPKYNQTKWVKMLCNQVPTIDAGLYGILGEKWSTASDRTTTYEGLTYPIYVKDELYNAYISDGSLFQALAGQNRIKRLSEFPSE